MWNWILYLISYPEINFNINDMENITNYSSYLVFGFLVLVVLDFITGIWKARVKGEKIRSKCLRHTVTKLVSYLLLILSSILLDYIFVYQVFEKSILVQLMALFLASIEFVSILENFGVILDKDLKQAFLDFLKKKEDIGKDICNKK